MRYSSVRQAIALLCFGLLSCTACVEALRTQNRSVGSPPAGFDVCDLLSPRELAGLGTEPGLHIAFRHAYDEDRLTCGYDAGPLIGGRTVITKVTPVPVTLTLWLDSGAESLEAMGSDGKRRVLPGVGDEAYIDLSDIDPYVKVYVRTGSRILELDFMRQEGDRVDPAAGRSAHADGWHWEAWAR